ncbi:uncharacterized protein LOC112568389 [Pomacea canaliculata]|nr:uncharacterized protein LOC112568389 [Pomacea canaliculata]
MSVELSSMDERQEVRQLDASETSTVNSLNHERNADPERGPTERSSDDPTHSGDEGRESEVSRFGVRTRGAPGGHLKKRLPFSRTTLMMLVLTGVTIVCCVPNIAVSVSDVEGSQPSPERMDSEYAVPLYSLSQRQQCHQPFHLQLL